jgi:hypothetical protein
VKALVREPTVTLLTILRWRGNRFGSPSPLFFPCAESRLSHRHVVPFSRSVVHAARFRCLRPVTLSGFQVNQREFCKDFSVVNPWRRRTAYLLRYCSASYWATELAERLYGRPQ